MADPKHVSCPICSAKAGEGCRNVVTGKPQKDHVSRWVKAQKATGGGEDGLTDISEAWSRAG